MYIFNHLNMKCKNNLWQHAIFAYHILYMYVKYATVKKENYLTFNVLAQYQTGVSRRKSEAQHKNRPSEIWQLMLIVQIRLWWSTNRSGSVLVSKPGRLVSCDGLKN